MHLMITETMRDGKPGLALELDIVGTSADEVWTMLQMLQRVYEELHTALVTRLMSGDGYCHCEACEEARQRKAEAQAQREELSVDEVLADLEEWLEDCDNEVTD